MGENIQNKKAEVAIRRGNVQELIAALSEGADADQILESGDRLIHEATETNDALLVGALLRLGANPNAQDAQGDTALHRPQRGTT
jgi:ankyrin repeat protein